MAYPKLTPVIATGATEPRYVADRFADCLNVKDFGAKGDGVTDDSDAVQAVVDKGGTIYFPKGVYCISKEISVTKAGTRLVGDGMGGGYRAGGRTPYTFHTDVTTLLFVENTQTNRSRVRTRYLARPTSSSPNDPPMSVCINVQAEHVHIQDLAVKLDITLPAAYLADPASYIGSVTEGANYGVDLDVGIFIGTRCHFTMRDCMVLGYFRKAGIWADSTQATNVPRFADADGNTYPDSNVSNGSDGMELYNVLVYGGFWGVRIQGPMPENPDTIYDKFPSDLRPAYYYDSILGEAVTDYRGGFGFSDVLLFGCSIYGFCHHTDVLWTDFDPSDSPTEFATTFKYGGALCVSGLAENPSRRIQGHRYIATRLTGGGAYDVYLGLTNRDLFLGCMLDHESMYDSSGNAETNWFGGIALTKNANLVRIIASMCPRNSLYINNTFTESYRVLNFGNEAGTWNNYHIPSNLSLGTSDPSEYSDATGITFRLFGRDDKQAHIVFSKIVENESEAITTGVIRHYFNGTGNPFTRFWFLPAGETDLTWPLSIQSSSTNHIFSSNSDKNVRVYAPSKKEWGLYSEDSNAVVLRITSDSNNDHYITTRNTVRPYASATDTLGTGSFRYKTLYISDGAINTSDERLKSNISDFPEEVLEAWGDVKWRQFKMKDAVAEKGEAARLHSGVIAQQIQEAFASKGLDASKYGLFCHDSWDDTYDTVSVVDVPERIVDGEKIPAETHDEKVLVRKRGEEYSVRYEEALVLECAYLRKRIEQLEERVNQLTNNSNK